MEPQTTDERRTGASPGTARDAAPEDVSEESGPATPDLLSIGLAVFFVSIVLIVGALLLVPAAF